MQLPYFSRYNGHLLTYLTALLRRTHKSTQLFKVRPHPFMLIVPTSVNYILVSV